MKYREYNDYELLNYVSENNEEARDILYKKYLPIINKLAKKIYPYVKNAGVEVNDLVQEGLLGLTSAITHFEEQKETTFYTYANTCIERKIISYVVGTKRFKNKILNESVSIEKMNDDGSSYQLEYLLSDNKTNPESLLMSSEYEHILIEKSKDVLTPLESSVFELKINGFEYREIADILEKDIKAIDNALQRIKLKMKNIIANLK